MVITGVADRLPDRVSCLVYLDAAVPHDGQSIADIAHIGPILRYQAKRHGDGWRVNPPRARHHGGLFGVTTELDLTWVRSQVTPQSLRTFTQPLRLHNPDAIAAIPHTFIQCTRRGPLVGLLRRMFPPNLPRTETGWDRRTIASGHDAMIIAPNEFTQQLLNIAIHTPN